MHCKKRPPGKLLENILVAQSTCSSFLYSLHYTHYTHYTLILILPAGIIRGNVIGCHGTVLVVTRARHLDMFQDQGRALVQGESQRRVEARLVDTAVSTVVRISQHNFVGRSSPNEELGIGIDDNLRGHQAGRGPRGVLVNENGLLVTIIIRSALPRRRIPCPRHNVALGVAATVAAAAG